MTIFEEKRLETDTFILLCADAMKYSSCPAKEKNSVHVCVRNLNRPAIVSIEAGCIHFI